MPKPNVPNYLLYFRDDLRLSTWILWGAVIQSLLVITLPHLVALLPAALILGTRIVLSTLRNEGFLPSSEAKGVVPGRHTAQVPNPDGSFPTTPSAKEICIFIMLRVPIIPKAASRRVSTRSPTTFAKCGRTRLVTRTNGAVSARCLTPNDGRALANIQMTRSWQDTHPDSH